MIESAVDSLTQFMLTKENAGSVDAFDIYNEWAAKSGYVIRDKDAVIWLLELIIDLKNINSTGFMKIMSDLYIPGTSIIH